MPTWATTLKFQREFAKLSPEAQKAFRVAVAKFVEDLTGIEDGDDGAEFRNGLNVEMLVGHHGIMSMAYSGDGRATFTMEHGTVDDDKVHVMWRRVGTHEVQQSP